MKTRILTTLLALTTIFIYQVFTQEKLGSVRPSTIYKELLRDGNERSIDWYRHGKLAGGITFTSDNQREIEVLMYDSAGSVTSYLLNASGNIRECVKFNVYADTSAWGEATVVSSKQSEGNSNERRFVKYLQRQLNCHIVVVHPKNNKASLLQKSINKLRKEFAIPPPKRKTTDPQASLLTQKPPPELSVVVFLLYRLAA